MTDLFDAWCGDMQIASKVVDVCLDRGSRDNMSVVIVAFDGFPEAPAYVMPPPCEHHLGCPTCIVVPCTACLFPVAPLVSLPA